MPVAVACTTERDVAKDAATDVHVCVCAECGVIQTSKTFDTSAYETPQFFSVGGVWAEHRKRLAEFIDASLPASADRTGAALEIGPSAQPILRALRRPITRVHYFDLMRDLPFVLQANERYEKQPFPPVGEAGVFDLIVASHVLEHAPSVFDFMSAVKRSLAPHGVAVLSLPHFAEWFSRKYWNAISCEHLTYPVVHQLAGLCARVGLGVEFAFFESHSVFMRVSKYTPAQTPKPQPVGDVSDALDAWVSHIHACVQSFERAVAETSDEVLLVGASHLGQYVSLLSPSIAARTRAVLDNAVAKHGQRLYGTPFTVRPFDHVKDFARPSVIVPPSPYASEMKAQLLELNPRTRVIT